MTTPHLHTLFDDCLARWPERDVLFFADSTMNFAALDVLVRRVQDELAAHGTGPGDRVLVVAENCAEHVALVLACSRLGAWSCGVNARMAPAEVAAFIAKADPKLVYFTSAASSTAMAHAQAHQAKPSALTGLSVAPGQGPMDAVTGALAARVATVIFTSGTTGQPKGVLMSHDGLVQFAQASARSRALSPEDRSYAFLPMTHIFGLGTVLAASLQAGAGLVMRQQFDPADLLDALAHHGVSNLQGPPALFARLMAHIDQTGVVVNAPRLRYLYTGAGPLDIALKRQIERCFGLPLHHGYGLSEYAGAACITPMNEVGDNTSAGRCVPGAELRIVDKDGRDLPAGASGEIWIRGSGLFPGYFRDEEATAAVMRPGGWYASGDLGQLAADGSLTVVGRLKEMIVRSGFNVYPAEVEAALNQHPAVQRSAVIGRAAAGGNEDIHAFVELRAGAVLDPAELKRFLAGQLSPYKRPTQVHTVQHLPMTLSGKVLKRELAATLDKPGNA